MKRTNKEPIGNAIPNKAPAPKLVWVEPDIDMLVRSRHKRLRNCFSTQLNEDQVCFVVKHYGDNFVDEKGVMHMNLKSSSKVLQTLEDVLILIGNGLDLDVASKIWVKALGEDNGKQKSL